MFTVLWDNDGVLVDTEGLYFQATKIVLESVGIDLTPEQFKEISLRRGESTFQLALDHGIDPDKVASLRAKRDCIYAESLALQSWVIDGVESVLRSLHGEVRMGVVTSSRRDHFEVAHAKGNLREYFDFVLTREDYQHTKPHPEPYLTALKRHSLRPQDCIVIEDSERGLASARVAGLECLIVLSEWTRDGDFRNACKVLKNVRCVPQEVLRRAKTCREVGYEREFS
jgi:HAD superfamily hydrolase (TIGR01509 family)